MATEVKIQEFGKNKQIMVTIPRAVAQLLGYKKGKKAKWLMKEGKLMLDLGEPKAEEVRRGTARELEVENGN